MIQIDYSKDDLLTEFSKLTLQDRYLVGDEQSPQEAFARAAEAFADDEAHAQRIYDYASKLWLCLQLLCYRMVELNEAYLLVVFLII